MSNFPKSAKCTSYSIMAERDNIPSIPVTTLAGLISLSDLLSELPLAESTQSSANKSLLFHPRVAEEANNLLQSQDPTLIEPLLQAIQQTNSDNIELKDAYKDSQSRVLPHDAPNLLQVIFSFDSNVFNHQRSFSQQQQASAMMNSSFQNHIPMHQQQQQQNVFNQSFQSSANTNTQQQILNQHNTPVIKNYAQNSSSSAHMDAFSQLNHGYSVNAGYEMNQMFDNVTNYQGQQQQMIYQQQNNSLDWSTSSSPSMGVGMRVDTMREMNFINSPNQSIMSMTDDTTKSPMLSSTSVYQQQQQQQNNQSFSQTSQNHMVQNILANPHTSSNNEGQKVVPRNNEYLQQQQQQRPSPAQASTAPETSQIQNMQNQNKFVQKTSNSQVGSAKHANSVNPSMPRTNMLEALRNSSTLIQSTSVEQQPTMVTQNQQQSMPSTNNTILNKSKATTIPIDDIAKLPLKNAVIKLDKITSEDASLMQTDLKSFIEKDPQKAAKYGVAGPNNDSLFSKMKEDDVRLPYKRKLPTNNLRTEDIVSKPKLRRVEKKLAPVVQKLTTEELMKTSNYQRFTQFMDQVLEELDETEAVVSLDEEENPDCIPSQLLNNISAECAKLKARNGIDALPENKLTLLISYAMRSLTIVKNVSAGPDVQDDIDDADILHKLVCAGEAALFVCNIYTCKSTKFLQEDNIDAIIKFVQFQLRETIFPSYDPVYTFETKKKIDKKKSKTKTAYHQKEITQLYHKIVEITKVLVQLYNKFHFVDTITIHASALGVEPFFVDNIETLQFVCLDLVTSIFQNEKYAAHRKNILAEILASVDRLPHSKRNLRPFKLTNNGGNIQMMTALVLQLIQCSVILPESFAENENVNTTKKRTSASDTKTDKDTYILTKYDTALSIGGNFLTTFLNKCKTRSGDTDFRPLFENFIHDLLTTVNRPEWPAAELLLSLLGMLLVKYMSDKNIDQSIRVVSLEYLGIVAARLRKDTVEARCKVDTMDQLIKLIKQEQEKEGDSASKDSIIEINKEEERTEFLQKMLLDYLDVNAQEDNVAWSHAKHFYLTLWYRDIIKLKRQIREGEKGYASRKKTARRKKNFDSDEDDDDENNSENESDDDTKHRKNKTIDEELNMQIFRALDDRKKYLLSKIVLYGGTNVDKDDIKTYLDYNNANLIAQYLASKRPFSQSFDLYLQKIILVVRENSIAIRTKAMKCLSNIVEVDQSVLGRKDMQIGVAQKLLDTAISVREAAVDLIGKYILSDVELVDQYYDMLSKRILDTGVSVRKRVIKILRDICVEFPAHNRIPDICVKMIRRVNDEEGIQKLVMEVFMTMWFTPCKDNDQAAMDRKIVQIIDVVCSASDNKGSCGLDDLLKTIFEPKENKEDTKAKKEIPASILKACQQIVNGLVNATMTLEGSDNSAKLVGCITALHLFAKVRPQLLVNHAETLAPYLNVKANTNSMVQFISSIAEILEQVVPLMDHPSETFLNELETNLMMQVFSNTQIIISSCISALASVVNKITKNYKLIRDCFKKFYYTTLVPSRKKLETDPNFPLAKIFSPMFRRSIYTIGLLLRHFDFKNVEVYGNNGKEDNLPPSICTDVFDAFAFFFNCDNIDIRRQTLISLGHFCVQNYEFLSKSELKEVYIYLLSQPGVQTDIKIQVLRNILMYLTEEEQIMVRRDKDWQTQSKTEDLKEMGDVSSGMASAIIQIYLKEILNCFLHREYLVRFWSMKVIEIVLRQGLIHPIKIVPFLICLSTDPEKEVAHSSDRHLQEIDKQYPGFVNMKTQEGLQLSYNLQKALQESPTNVIVRGFRVKEKNEPPSALNGFLYSLLRNTKPTRRALIQSIIKQFDDQKISLHQMLYLADNLAYFPYAVQDEPLYLIHQIDLLISVSGTNVLANFREGLKPNPIIQNKPENLPEALLDEDDEEDIDALYERLPEDTTELEKCITSAQGCMLMLILKQQLKEIYGITDSKISRYTPSDTTKAYDKAMQRRSNSIFNPKATIIIIKEQRNPDEPLDEKGRRRIVERYLEFKELMLKLDAEDSDNEDGEKLPKQTSLPSQENVNLTKTPQKTQDWNSAFLKSLNNDVPVEIDDGNAITTKSTNKSSAKKASTATKKRRKRKASTTDEESDYNSDDYE
ncbi:nipped-B protein [Culicoides brevitarsis]|uniref:nipped-B protein n=1 Tax=Culicoides brevitarsis TaxID=469753 RepID=UPI00307B475B